MNSLDKEINVKVKVEVVEEASEDLQEVENGKVPEESKIQNKHIFIFGGSGSLGNTLIKKYLNDNIITVYSRDENKHWLMNLEYKTGKINYIIGDIRDKDKVRQSLIRANPHYVIIASALKHIDRCEYDSNECIETNLLGTKNILDIVEINRQTLSNLKVVCFISTDKACSPVNIYGMCKATSEALVVEKSKYISDVKFVTVRYGNVLNSRGSIIPIMHNVGQDSNATCFTLTDVRMTRFIMTLAESVALIEYAMLHGSSGDIVIPKLYAMRIYDLVQIFSELYNKPIKITTIRPGEKLHESLINETQSIRVSGVVSTDFVDKPSETKEVETQKPEYYHIKPPYSCKIAEPHIYDYNSSQNILGKEELHKILSKYGLLKKNIKDI